tara:strand:+ start:1112 stop:1606 length:495 start_codon:yes stop_codon:yes gene_type:complete
MNPEGMTAEEKAGLMQLMGQTYGEAHKQDQMLVGQSGNLQPQSQHLKQQFEQVAKAPTVPPRHNYPPPPQPSPEQQPAAPSAPIQQVTPEQAAQEIAAAPQPTPVAPVAVPAAVVDTGNQLEFDLSEPSKIDKLIKLTEKTNLILEQIRLKLDNGKTAKGNKQK